jgi:hypothetical protein
MGTRPVKPFFVSIMLFREIAEMRGYASSGQHLSYPKGALSAYVTFR